MVPEYKLIVYKHIIKTNRNKIVILAQLYTIQVTLSRDKCLHAVYTRKIS